MPSIQHEATLLVRLYNADNTKHRDIPLSAVAPGVTARVTAQKGYEDASIVLYGKRADFPGLVRRRRMELWLRYRNGAGTVVSERAYRGFVKKITPSKGLKDNTEVLTVAVSLVGLFSEASKKVIQKRYANSTGADKAEIFADFTGKFVTTGRLADVQIQALPIGDVPLEVDVYDMTNGEAVTRLADEAGRVVTGGDVQPGTTADRLIFRPFDSESDPAKHVLVVPSSQVGGRSGDEDSSRQATVLRIVGGAMGPNRANLLAEAVEGNTSFEMPVLSGDSPVGNLVNPVWSAHNGADASGQANGIEPFFGETYFDLPEPTAYVESTQDSPPETLIVSDSEVYVFSVRARRANGEAGVEGEARLYWLDGGGGQVGVTITLPLTPLTTEWTLYSVNLIVPTDAEGFRIQVECTDRDGVTSDYRLLADDVRLYRLGQVTQRGWGRRTSGGGQFKVLRWDEDSTSLHGGRCLYVDAIAGDPDDDCIIEPFGQNRFTVYSGQQIVAGFFAKLAPGSPDAVIRLLFKEWDNKGETVGETTIERTVTSEDWAIFTIERDLQEETAQALFWWDFNSDAQVYIDCAFTFDRSAPAPDIALTNPGQFIEGANFQTVLYAVDLFPSGPIHDEAVELGDVWATENRDELTNQADAETYGTAYFARYTLPLDRPYVVTYGVIETADGRSTVSAWPGEYMRAIGKDGEEWLPSKKPLFEKQILWDSKVTITLYLADNPDEPQRKLAQILRKERGKRSVGGGSRGGSGGGLSGSAGGGGGAGTGVSSLNSLTGGLTLAGTDGIDVTEAGSTITVSGADLADDIQIVSDDLDALDASLGTAAFFDTPVSGNASNSQVVRGNDPRLSDARTPTTHNHAATDINSGTMATARLGSGTANSTTFLRGDQTWQTVATSGLNSRGTQTATTSSLAAGATDSSQTIAAGLAALLLSVSANYPCWIRVYSSAAARTADLTRTRYEDPVAGNGVLADIFITSAGQEIWMAPVLHLYNSEAVYANTVYLRITNDDSVTRTIIVTFKKDVVEA